MGKYAPNTNNVFFRMPDTLRATYCGWDAWATAHLADAETQLLHDNGQWKYFEEEVWPLIPSVMAMQSRGLPIDLDEKTRLRRSFRADVRECDHLLYEAVGQEFVDPWTDRSGQFNTNSDHQLRKWLFGVSSGKHREPGTPVEILKDVTIPCLGLRPAGKTDTKLWSVDQNSLFRIYRDLRKMDEPHRPVLEALLHRSKFAKLDEYLNLDIEDRGMGPRVYPRIKMYGTASLRYAYAEPPVQSWAEEIRPMVRARPNHKLVGADFSAIEARVAAYLAHDKIDIAVYEKGEDIHVHTAMEVFGLSREEWDAHDPETAHASRDYAKRSRYRRVYGGDAETAQEKTLCPCPKCRHKLPPTLGLSMVEQKRIDDRWFDRHYWVRNWRKQVELDSIKGAVPGARYSLILPMGLPTIFCYPKKQDGHLLRLLYNRPIQHTATAIMHRCQRRLHREGVPLILQHHDAFYAEVPEERAESTRQLIVQVMQTPVPEMNDVVFPCDSHVGDAWSDLH